MEKEVFIEGGQVQNMNEISSGETLLTEFEHLLPEYQHIATRDAEERIQFMAEPRWIEYSAATKILRELKRLLDLSVRTKMQNMLIVGEPNNGKTTLVRTFREMHGQPYINEQEVSVKPVIIAEAPPSADEKGLYISILERLETPYRVTATARDLRFRTINLLRDCHTKMLVIDEFHSLLTGSTRKQHELMNTVKMLCNELAIPIIGVGTQEAVQVLHTDPQHASRFDVARLPAWKPDKEFQRLLQSFEKILPLRKKSEIQYPDLAVLIHTICGGNIGNLNRLLVECATQAIRSGTEQINKKIVEGNSWMQPTNGIRERPV